MMNKKNKIKRLSKKMLNNYVTRIKKLKNLKNNSKVLVVG